MIFVCVPGKCVKQVRTCSQIQSHFMLVQNLYQEYNEHHSYLLRMHNNYSKLVALRF